MENIIEVDDQLIANKLAEPEWPWIIALAYSAEARTPNAIATVIWWRDYYDQRPTRKIATGLTLTHLYRLIAGETPEFDWSVIEDIERPLIQAIREGDIQSFGSEEPLSKPQPIDKTVWARGEIAMAEWSDLKPIGERKSDEPTPAHQNPTWYYDIHVDANAVRNLMGPLHRQETTRPAFNYTKYEVKSKERCQSGAPKKGKDEIDALLTQRINDRNLAEDLASEAFALRSMLQQRNLQLAETGDVLIDIPTVKTIENNIRSRFWAAKPRPT